VARNPTTASYIPNVLDRGNSSGSSVRAKRTAQGQYLVLFTGVGASGGVALATALGTSARDCHPLWRAGVNGAEMVYVFCYDGSGAPADSRFVASYLNTPLPNGHDLAYLRDDQPSTVSYDPTAAYNSNGGTNHIDRTGTGQYTVALPGLGGLDGNVEIAALANLLMPGTSPGICRSNGWGTVSADQVAYVSCRNPAGVLTDLPFSLTFGDRLGLRGNSTGKAAYFWADLPTSASYLPDSTYRWSSSGQGPRVTRSGAGHYTVHLTGINGHGGSAEVTAYSRGTTRCQVSSISTSGATQLVGVLCRASGTSVDSSFNFVFTR
jgi:hypothetical protein